MNEAFSLIGEVGFPIAIALIAGFFIFLTIKYILESVIGQVNGIHGIVHGLDNRVKTMNHDIIRLQQKLDTVIEMREQNNEKLVDND